MMNKERCSGFNFDAEDEGRETTKDTAEILDDGYWPAYAFSSTLTFSLSSEFYFTKKHLSSYFNFAEQNKFKG